MFFWKPESHIQKSLDGLMRCLLHDVLRACPELITEVFLDQWNKLSASPVEEANVFFGTTTFELRLVNSSNVGTYMRSIVSRSSPTV